MIFSSWADVLIDSGASHSFISLSFVTALGLEPQELYPGLMVETPIRGRVKLDRICRGCDLMILDQTFTFDFIIMDMATFDVILGMDWLSYF